MGKPRRNRSAFSSFVSLSFMRFACALLFWQSLFPILFGILHQCTLLVHRKAFLAVALSSSYSFVNSSSPGNPTPFVQSVVGTKPIPFKFQACQFLSPDMSHVVWFPRQFHGPEGEWRKRLEGRSWRLEGEGVFISRLFSFFFLARSWMGGISGMISYLAPDFLGKLKKNRSSLPNLPVPSISAISTFPIFFLNQIGLYVWRNMIGRRWNCF